MDIFQSSRSLRTATRRTECINFLRIHFNPRGPCGPRPGDIGICPCCPYISILAVLADRDETGSNFNDTVMYFNPRGPCGPRRKAGSWMLSNIIFQSSRSLRTATELPSHSLLIIDISILAVLADRDSGFWQYTSMALLFQSSRSLRTATTSHRQVTRRIKTFQSSRSLRTATCSAPFKTSSP